MLLRTAEVKAGKRVMRILIGSMLIIFAAVCGTQSVADGGENTGSISRIAVDESLIYGSATEDHVALELGHKVLAVMAAINNPKGQHAMRAVIDLGRNQRYYVLVRGWLAYQLQSDMSILQANKKRTRKEIRQRIEFLNKAIRAIDLD